MSSSRNTHKNSNLSIMNSANPYSIAPYSPNQALISSRADSPVIATDKIVSYTPGRTITVNAPMSFLYSITINGAAVDPTRIYSGTNSIQVSSTAIVFNVNGFDEVIIIPSSTTFKDSTNTYTVTVYGQYAQVATIINGLKEISGYVPYTVNSIQYYKPIYSTILAPTIGLKEIYGYISNGGGGFTPVYINASAVTGLKEVTGYVSNGGGGFIPVYTDALAITGLKEVTGYVSNGGGGFIPVYTDALAITGLKEVTGYVSNGGGGFTPVYTDALAVPGLREITGYISNGDGSNFSPVYAGIVSAVAGLKEILGYVSNGGGGFIPVYTDALAVTGLREITGYISNGDGTNFSPVYAGIVTPATGLKQISGYISNGGDGINFSPVYTTASAITGLREITGYISNGDGANFSPVYTGIVSAVAGLKEILGYVSNGGGGFTPVYTDALAVPGLREITGYISNGDGINFSPVYAGIVSAVAGLKEISGYISNGGGGFTPVYTDALAVSGLREITGYISNGDGSNFSPVYAGIVSAVAGLKQISGYISNGGGGFIPVYTDALAVPGLKQISGYISNGGGGFIPVYTDALAVPGLKQISGYISNGDGANFSPVYATVASPDTTSKGLVGYVQYGDGAYYTPVYKSTGPFIQPSPSVDTIYGTDPLNPDTSVTYLQGSVNALPNGTQLGQSKTIVRGNANPIYMALGTGVNYAVHAIAFDSLNNAYACGEFTLAGGVSAIRIAKWNGSAWSALGTGLTGGSFITCNAIAIDSLDNVYVGGNFTSPANNIAKWDGSSWSALGTGLNNGCMAITIDSLDNVYAGGYFTSPANNIAKWNGSAWSALGTGLTGAASALCRAIANDSLDNVYAGGEFTLAGGVSANYIAKWNGSAWSALGTGLTGGSVTMCSEIAIDSLDNVYAGGEFTSAGGVSANNIAKWTPGSVSWSALGTGLSYQCSALSIDNVNRIYAGQCADFNMLQWDPVPGSWSTLLTLDNDVYSISFDNSNRMYIGGYFTTPVNYLMQVLRGSTVTGNFIQDGVSYTSLTFSDRGSSAVLNYDTFESKWAIITTSPYTIMA
jgi:hypothetical protein